MALNSTVYHRRDGRRLTLLAGILMLAWAAAAPLAHAQPTPNPNPNLKLRSYPLQHIDPQHAETQLGNILRQVGQPYEIAVDPTTNGILLRGSEHAHRLAGKLIAAIDGPPQRPDGKMGSVGTAPAAERPPPQRKKNPARVPPTGHFVQLRHMDWRALHAALERLIDQPLPITTTNQDEIARFPLSTLPGARAEVEVQVRTGRVVVRGHATLAQSWAQVVRALDNAASRPLGTTQLIAIRSAEPDKIRTVLDAIQGSTAAQRTSDRRGPPHRQTADSGTRKNQLLTMRFPPNDAGKPRPQATAPTIKASAQLPDDQPGAADSPPPRQNEQPPAGGAIGPVKIEYLEGSDVIVIEGSERDVARVRELIRQIEQLSTETEPVVQIQPLLHVGSEALAALVNSVYEQVFLPRQGNVSVTPLVKPNALLLIGREDNVKTAVELIQQLDHPVDAASQFRVFHLKHTSAADAKGTIDQFFQQRPGLGTTARVTADFRTNALIVQAGPRDMVELEALLSRIDTGTTESVNDIRVFPLQNSPADELAEILRDAIESGQPPSRAAAPSRPAAPSAPSAPGATPGDSPPPGGRTAPAPSPAATTPGGRSTSLRFLAIDSEGKKQFRSGILADVRITSDPRANALLVSAPAESMDLIAALIRTLDQMPAAELQIKVFTIANGNAASLVEMFEQLFAGRTDGAAGGGTVGPEGDRSIVPMRFSLDARSNSIIASGSENDLSIVEAILLRLDESDVRRRETKVYRLSNSYAQAVAEALNAWIEQQRQLQQAIPDVTPIQDIEYEVVVVPEVVSNTLIVSAAPDYFAEISRIVEQLDERPPMVMIQVLIAEVGLNDADEFGVELGLQDSLLFDRSLLGDLLTTTNSVQTSTADGVVTNTQQIIQAASLTPGFGFNGPSTGNSGSDRSLGTSGNVGGQALSNFAVGRLNSELGFGGLVLSASSESVSVLIRALQESRRIEILSRPQIMTLDNQPAYIQVGQSVPRVRGSAVNQGVQSNVIVDEDVGIILGVVPRISPDGMVMMQVDATKSEVGPEEEGIPVSILATGDVVRSPRINRTFAQTTVSATSGQTIVLGGLITTSKSDIHRRVPWLADVPILGHLFRYDAMVERRTELLIIMTPHVIRTPEDAEMIKRTEASRMNWCLADVVEMHGTAGLRGRSDPWYDHETETIYPQLEMDDGSPVPAEQAPPAGLQYDLDPFDSPSGEPRPLDLNDNNAAQDPGTFRRLLDPRQWIRRDASVQPAGHRSRSPNEALSVPDATAKPTRLPPVPPEAS